MTTFFSDSQTEKLSSCARNFSLFVFKFNSYIYIYIYIYIYTHIYILAGSYSLALLP